MTLDQIEQMKKLRNDGLSYRVIGDKVGCGANTVRNYILPGAREKDRERGREYRANNREALNESSRKWREKNRDAISERRREWSKNNKEIIKERQHKWYAEHGKEYYERNKEVLNERTRKWRKNNKDKIKAQAARWLAENPGYYREYHKKNKEAINARSLKWAKDNPIKTREKRSKQRALKAEVTIGDLSEIKKVYDIAEKDTDVVCYLRLDGCPYANGEKIAIGDRHVDHIKPLSRGGSHTASNLAISCSKCNLRKGARLLEELEDIGFTGVKTKGGY